MNDNDDYCGSANNDDDHDDGNDCDNNYDHDDDNHDDYDDADNDAEDDDADTTLCCSVRTGGSHMTAPNWAITGGISTS